jgi:hypothetical protein
MHFPMLDIKENSVKIRSVTTLMAAMVVVSLFSSGANAGGLTSDQLVAAGYDCFPAGPNDWTHCLLGRKFGQRAIPVKVFSVDGSEFLGTEQLLRDDIYAGQPCPQDGLGQWDSQGVPGYFACHHFETGHH